MNQRRDEPDPSADLPPSLARALVEPAEYALRLRTGELIHFARAERQGAFIVLHAPSGPPPDPRLLGGMELFPSGVEVRISDIVWCASGPGQARDPAGELQARHPDATGGVRVPVRLTNPDDSPGGGG